MSIVLGIDIGGTGIKGALVDTDKGELVVDRFRLVTPQPATPVAVTETVAEIVQHFDWVGKEGGRIGCGFPAVMKHGKAYTAANVDPSWIGTDARALFEAATKCTVTMVNDADAAGLAEMKFGAGRGKKGVVFLCTIGTGIGSALFVDGVLVPNTELGHIEVEGNDAETRTSEKARIEQELSWKRWAKRVDKYLHAIERLFWPDLIIIGGGVSKDADEFLPRLTIHTPVVAAQLLNEAGIVGAALSAL
jgi:polyphosphate glucokinase